MAQLLRFRDFAREEAGFELVRHRRLAMSQSRHAHDYYQIVYVVQGVCVHDYLGRRMAAAQGDVYIVPPGAEHSLHALRDVPGADLALLDFLPSFVREFDRSFPRRRSAGPSAPDAAPMDRLPPWLHISAEKQPLVEQLLIDIADELQGREEGYLFSIRLSLVKLLLLFERECRKMARLPLPLDIVETGEAAGKDTEPAGAAGMAGEAGGASGKAASEKAPETEGIADSQACGEPIRLGCAALPRENGRFAEVIRYVRENYAQDIALEQGAQMAGMNLSYFSHCFKQETGKSFIAFVREWRTEQAKPLIRQNRFTVAEVALRVGFRDTCHFIRTFRKLTGLTPTEYRKREKAGSSDRAAATDAATDDEAQNAILKTNKA